MRGRPEWFRQANTIVPPGVREQVFTGPWRALVDDNEDPGKLGRVFVIIPEVTGQSVHPTAAWPCATPLGGGAADGKKWGSLFLPEKGDAVWVEFIDGDPEHPVWYPGWFGEDELPELLQQNYPKRRGFVTPSGHAVIFDDSDEAIGDVQLIQRDGAMVWLKGNKDAALTTAGGLSLLLENDGKKATLKADANTSLVLDATAKTAVLKVSALTITVDNTAGKITVLANGKDVELKATTVKVTGALHVTGDLTVDGKSTLTGETDVG